jgi:hypothetical protein
MTTADAKVELVKRLLNYDFGDESAHCIALAEAIGDLLPALEASHSLTEAITPVAWRYRYLHKGDGTDHWIVRQSPAYSSEPSQYSVGVEAEPLYTAAQAARPIAPETNGPMLTADEEAGLVERINANPNLHPIAPVQDDDAELVAFDAYLAGYAAANGVECAADLQKLDAYHKAHIGAQGFVANRLGKQSLGDGR